MLISETKHLCCEDIGLLTLSTSQRCGSELQHPNGSEDTGRELRPFVVVTFCWLFMNTLSVFKVFSQWKVIAATHIVLLWANNVGLSAMLTGQQAQALWCLVGGSKRDFCGPKRVCLREEANGLKKSREGFWGREIVFVPQYDRSAGWYMQQVQSLWQTSPYLALCFGHGD